MTHHNVLRTGIWSAAAGLALGVFAPLALAQPHGHGNDHRGGPQAQQPAPRAQAQPQHRSDATRPGNRYGHAHAPGRGAGPDHNLHRGGKLPPAWRTKHYVVDDWRGHGLSRPPRGQHWVQAGSDYLLVAIASGLIVQIVLH